MAGAEAASGGAVGEGHDGTRVLTYSANGFAEKQSIPPQGGVVGREAANAITVVIIDIAFW